MKRLSAYAFLPLLIAAVSHATEITVEERPFAVETSFTATALPDQGGVLLQLVPDLWQDFEIVKLTPHGSKVAKNDVLISFETEAIDRKIADAQSAVKAGALKLAQAELELKNLLETSPHKLEALRRWTEIAREENAYFASTRRKATEESAAQALERKKQYLENQKEELTQLTAMYAADDLTEDTEEIILTRQKDAVASAEFGLRMEELEFKRMLEVSLPREAVALANNERDTAINLVKSEQEIPRLIEINKIELETLKTTTLREKEALAKLEHDRSLFEFKAPADGIFYHGPIDNGSWTTGDAIKTLYIHGQPVLNRPFATFVPSPASLNWTAFLNEADARSLKPGLVGSATLAGREELDIPVKLATLATAPGTDGRYRADLTATSPGEFTPAIGATAKVRVISYQNPAAIAIPTEALSFGPKGWTLEVKLADGTTEQRPVRRGRVSGKNVEILSGLEVGQVVLAP